MVMPFKKCYMVNTGQKVVPVKNPGVTSSEYFLKNLCNVFTETNNLVFKI